MAAHCAPFFFGGAVLPGGLFLPAVLAVPVHGVQGATREEGGSAAATPWVQAGGCSAACPAIGHRLRVHAKVGLARRGFKEGRSEGFGCRRGVAGRQPRGRACSS